MFTEVEGSPVPPGCGLGGSEPTDSPLGPAGPSRQPPVAVGPLHEHLSRGRPVPLSIHPSIHPGNMGGAHCEPAGDKGCCVKCSPTAGGPQGPEGRPTHPQGRHPSSVQRGKGRHSCLKAERAACGCRVHLRGAPTGPGQGGCGGRSLGGDRSTPGWSVQNP